MPTASIPPGSSPADNARDLAIVLAAIAAAWILSRWVIYPALSIPDNAPLILRPICGFLAAWWVVHRRGAGLRSLGLRVPDSWARAVLVGIALYAADYAVGAWVAPWLASIVQPVQRPSFFAYVHGNTGAFALWVAVSWLVGGLSEETLFRGFLLTRVEALLGKKAAAVAAAIVAQALLFGALHLYAGTFAFLYATLFGITHGIFYAISGRNLVPLIVVHGTWDTVAFYGTYSS
ncbi:MAG TPA: CPBP family intramembrane glutamic endopeptidase [Usitatibacter sp.]|nr:CPBP family intramembrane glutamic endopeptidase [Usitatibacter sp.]